MSQPAGYLEPSSWLQKDGGLVCGYGGASNLLLDTPLWDDEHDLLFNEDLTASAAGLPPAQVVPDPFAAFDWDMLDATAGDDTPAAAASPPPAAAPVASSSPSGSATHVPSPAQFCWPCPEQLRRPLFVLPTNLPGGGISTAVVKPQLAPVPAAAAAPQTAAPSLSGTSSSSSSGAVAVPTSPTAVSGGGAVSFVVTNAGGPSWRTLVAVPSLGAGVTSTPAAVVAAAAAPSSATLQAAVTTRPSPATPARRSRQPRRQPPKAALPPAPQPVIAKKTSSKVSNSAAKSYAHQQQQQEQVAGLAAVLSSPPVRSRAEAVARYRAKRANRQAAVKRVRYQRRKDYADTRPRVGGRFVKMPKQQE